MLQRLVGTGLILGGLLAAVARADEEPPATPAAPVERTIEDAARIVAKALISEDWRPYEATLVTADDVRFLEKAAAKAPPFADKDEQLAGVRGFVARHGGYEGAAARQRKDAVARCQKARGDVPSDVDWSQVSWGRPLPLRSRLVRHLPFENREAWFSLRSPTRELAFVGQVIRIRGGWTFLAGVDFRETIVHPVETPTAKTHALAGLWVGQGAAAPGERRDVTLWLQPLEQADRYVARMLSSRHEPRGTSVWSKHALGVTWSEARLLWADGSLSLDGDVLQGRFEKEEIVVRHVALDEAPSKQVRTDAMDIHLQGIAAVYAPSFADVRRSTFALGMKRGEGVLVTVDVRSGEDGDPAVASLLRQTLAAHHLGSALLSVGGKASYFSFHKQPDAGFFRLVHADGNPFGRAPGIVHGYAPWK